MTGMNGMPNPQQMISAGLAPHHVRRAQDYTARALTRQMANETPASREMRASMTGNIAEAIVILFDAYSGVGPKNAHVALVAALADLVEIALDEYAAKAGSDRYELLLLWPLICDLAERRQERSAQCDEHFAQVSYGTRETVPRMADCISALLPYDMQKVIGERMFRGETEEVRAHPPQKEEAASDADG